jgi:hypothetical protein
MKTTALAIPAALAALALSTGVAFASQPSTGSWDPAVGRQATRALNLLEAKGYGDFRNFQSRGSDFTASVKEQNRIVTLLIDPDAGNITAEN